MLHNVRTYSPGLAIYTFVGSSEDIKGPEEGGEGKGRKREGGGKKGVTSFVVKQTDPACLTISRTDRLAPPTQKLIRDELVSIPVVGFCQPRAALHTPPSGFCLYPGYNHRVVFFFNPFFVPYNPTLTSYPSNSPSVTPSLTSSPLTPSSSMITAVSHPL